MELRITLKDRTEIEKMLLVMALGMLDSLEQGALTFEQAYRLLLRPYVSQYLEEYGSQKEILVFFNNLCMLEDVARLVPEKLNISINSSRQEAVNLLKNIPISEDSELFWLNDFDE